MYIFIFKIFVFVQFYVLFSPVRCRTRDVPPQKDSEGNKKTAAFKETLFYVRFSVQRKPINKRIKSIADVFSFYYVQQHKRSFTNQIQSSYSLFIYIYIFFLLLL